MKKYAVELVGTFFLTMAVAFTGNPLAIGATLIVLVYMGGYISGGHYNPAVTLAVWMQNGVTATEALWYWLVQFVGAILAALVYFAVTGGFFTVVPVTGFSFATALLMELLFTFLLAATVLHTAVSKSTQGNDYYGLAIGLALMVGAFAAGPISGGALNPAIGIGPQLFHLSELTQHWNVVALYLVGPLAGATLAGLLHPLTQRR